MRLLQRLSIGEPDQIIGHVGEVLGNDVDHQALNLQLSAHGEKLGFEDDLTLSREYPAPYHDVGDAGFIFQRRENNAACRAGTLANKDQPGNLDALPIFGTAQFRS